MNSNLTNLKHIILIARSIKIEYPFNERLQEQAIKIESLSQQLITHIN